jgi:aryl-alcohol dehydrogenase-like predicted oxidoreductase
MKDCVKILSKQYTRLGSTGLKVSLIYLGAMSFGNVAEWMIEIEKAVPIVKRALDLGINFVDTAKSTQTGDLRRF